MAQPIKFSSSVPQNVVLKIVSDMECESWDLDKTMSVMVFKGLYSVTTTSGDHHEITIYDHTRVMTYAFLREMRDAIDKELKRIDDMNLKV